MAPENVGTPATISHKCCGFNEAGAEWLRKTVYMMIDPTTIKRLQ